MAAAAVFAVSCNMEFEGLEQYPLDKESEGSYFKTADQLQVFSNSFYGDIFSGKFHNETCDLYISSTLGSSIRGGNNRTTPSSGGGWSWSTLANINAMLDNLYRCGDSAVREQYEGLGRFFRAYFYFKMVQTFGDVPWYDHELDVAEKDELYKPRDSRDYVMEKMLADVDYAIDHLGEEKQLYRVTKWTAMAFKSRFCLYEGTWRKYHGNVSPITGETYAHDADYYLKLAAEVSRSFIDDAPYGIYNTGNPETDYTHLFNQQTSPDKEVILAKSFSIVQQVSHEATYNCFGTPISSSFTKKFVDMFLMKDGSRFTDREGWDKMEFFEEVSDRDPRLAQIIRTPGYMREGVDSLLCPDFNQGFTGYQPVKYCMSWKDYPSWGWGQTDNDIPIYRAAEVYLNYAEAQAERSDYDITDADIAMSVTPIRLRAGMPAMKTVAQMDADPDNKYMGSSRWGYSNVKGKHKGTILEIRRERIVEMPMEGSLRWHDLMRYKEGKCLEQEMYGMYFSSLGAKDFDMAKDKKGNYRYEAFLYKDAAGKDSAPADVPAFQVGTGYMVLTEDTSGYIDPHWNVERTFDENRDYLNPIPTGELSINHNLVQNPGWKDIKR